MGVCAVAGCSSAGPTRADLAAARVYRSPVRATLSWFFAINHKDKAAAVAHFAPAQAAMMAWGEGDVSTWPSFSALHCKQLSGGAASAVIYCTFNESQEPADGQVDNFWTVSLNRQPDGRWLITNYGQG